MMQTSMIWYLCLDPPKLIWLRLGNTSSKNLARIFSLHSEIIKSFLTDNNYKELACLEIDQ